MRLVEKLGPYIEGKDAIMRTSIDVLQQVAMTLYYLSDECRMRKTANTFGVMPRDNGTPWTKIHYINAY